MIVRPPRKFTVDFSAQGSNSVLHYEILQEQASALGRLGTSLEAALQGLRDFDCACQSIQTEEDKRNRTVLLNSASRALWEFIVQREACGLRDTRTVMRDYKVPAEVQDRLGIFSYIK